MISPVLVLAQAVAVVANPALRPTPVIHANVQYTVAVDSALGGLVLRDLTVPPVTLAGAIRVEGAEPLARQQELRVRDDSVVFGADGRVRLLVADAARPPIQIEVDGGASAPGGRIRLLARGWPLNRVMLVTVRPADIREYVWRSAGWGERDRVRVDARSGMAWLTDPTTGMSAAIGFGRDTRGRIQGDATDIIVQRRYGEQVADERRTVAALVIAVEPSREADGTARAELVFGIGRDEESAARAASAAAATPESAPPAPRLRLVTPEPAIQALATHLFASAWPALAAGWIPGSLVEPYSRATGSAAAIPLALQAGRGAALCSEYARFRDVASGDGSQKAAIATRLGAQGPYRWVLDSDSSDAASAEAALILIGYACYRANRDSLWLRAELPRLVAMARVAGGRTLDAMRPDAWERLAELVEAAAEPARLRESRATADSLRRLATLLRGPQVRPRGEALWREIAATARRGVTARYGRLGAAEAGNFLTLVVGQLFGIDERLDRVVIAPAIDRVFSDLTWRVEGYRLHDDTLSVSYRPADEAATIRLIAPARRRVQLGFPWLTPASCVTVRRGRDSEQAMLVTTVDGEAWVDIRGAFQPAEITVRARACEG
jgi:hypothetical protein